MNTSLTQEVPPRSPLAWLLSNGFLYSVITLLLSVIIVHSIFVLHVRPKAQSIMTQQRAAMLANPAYVAERSMYVVIKDYEQEACITLMIWALAILLHRALEQREERRYLDSSLIDLPEGIQILPEDTRVYARKIQSLSSAERNRLAPRALLAALARFGATRNVQDVSSVAHSVCESEANRFESELSMLRYIAWAIPAIGFIGTVRGIGDALSQAHKAVSGDISGVTEGLGVAFNSTLIALLLSILLMFLLQALQRVQERLVQDTETYLDQRIIRNMQAPR